MAERSATSPYRGDFERDTFGWDQNLFTKPLVFSMKFMEKDRPSPSARIDDNSEMAQIL